ncbi:MAG: glycosyltransferase family 2 protein [Bacteroidales bacterium]|nr:glycosyltransferase family 2 protein [Candidatus Physcocola equi]
MNKTITILPYNSNYTNTLLHDHSDILFYGPECNTTGNIPYVLCEENIFSSKTLRLILSEKNVLQHEKIILITQQINFLPSECFFREAEDQKSLLSYSNYFDDDKNETVELIDYQLGSIRDGFKFGPVLIIKNSSKLVNLIDDANYHFAGLYDFILRISESELPHKIDKVLYHISQGIIDNRKSGEKQFDYLDPRKREAQLEYEKAATDHLKRIGAFIDSNKLLDINYNEKTFDTYMSVIIPVYNREKTIADAVKSALAQKLDKPFNVIVVDNHSTDQTTPILKQLAKENKQLIHIIPEEKDLKIGGCWNKAILSDHCGMFAVQLDSDDIYNTNQTLQKIADKFEEEKCAMVIGSYELTNFQLQPLPPGVIDHKEWTSTNGMNNAIRINGLGAPRCFYTPVVRQILFPNCSYGEDYAMGLAISRQFKLGRIYDVLYTCRRWEGNSDADLSQKKQNENDFAKDKMRSNEIVKRQLLNGHINTI